MGISAEEIQGSIECIAEIRYGSNGARCRIRLEQDASISCRFEQAQRAITPGQIFVAYNKEGEILLSGEID